MDRGVTAAFSARRAVFLSVTLLAMLVGGSRALAQPLGVDWSQTFNAQTVVSYLEEGKSRFLVVAGASDRQTGRAGLVFQAALRNTGKIEQIIEGEVLGAVDLLDDQAIVQRAARLPVHIVAVVRLLGAPERPLAMVNFYTLQGELRLTLSARAGEPLLPLSSDVMGSSLAGSESAASPAPSARQLAQSEYDEFALGFVGLGYADTSVSQTTLRSLDAYEGQSQRRLSPAEFYTKLGQTELAKTYEQRRNAAVRRLVSGGVLFGLSSVTIIGTTVGLSANTSVSNFQTSRDWLTAAVIGSSLCIITGITLTGVGIARYLDRHPIPPSEALRLADQYNRSLRRRLGLQARLFETLRGLTLRAAVSPQGASLATGLQF